MASIHINGQAPQSALKANPIWHTAQLCTALAKDGNILRAEVKPDGETGANWLISLWVGDSSTIVEAGVAESMADAKRDAWVAVQMLVEAQVA